MFMIEPVSIGSPAFFQAFCNLLAVTLLPKSLPTCLTAPVAEAAASFALPAKAPAPRFSFAPNVFGLSKPNSPCSGSASARYKSNLAVISSIDSVPLGFSPPLRSNSPCSGSTSLPSTFISPLASSPDACNEPCAVAAITSVAPLIACSAVSLACATAAATSFVKAASSTNCLYASLPVLNSLACAHSLSKISMPPA